MKNFLDKHKSRIRNFTDIETFEKEYDEDGRFIPLEERITEEQNVFYEDSISTPPEDAEKLMLRLALKKLTSQQRKIIDCIYFDGMSEQTTAERLHITQQAVNKHYQAALTKLKKFCLDK